MSTATPPVASAEVDYPESDGLPMADNEIQYEWIVTIKGGLDAVFRDDPDVYVRGICSGIRSKGTTRPCWRPT